jgi:hypothetical protein
MNPLLWILSLGHLVVDLGQGVYQYPSGSGDSTCFHPPGCSSSRSSYRIISLKY